MMGASSQRESRHTMAPAACMRTALNSQRRPAGGLAGLEPRRQRTTHHKCRCSAHPTCQGTRREGKNCVIIGGRDPGNAIWQNSGILEISANTGNNTTLAIGNGSEKCVHLQKVMLVFEI
jgi:hypothetical protein